MSPDFYIPPAFVEAIGRAAIARYEFELSFDILTAVLTTRCNYAVICFPFDPLEEKLNCTLKVQRSKFLKHQWWVELRTIISQGIELNAQYRNATTSSVYGRGAGNLENRLRELANQLHIPPPPSSMTPSKIDSVANEFRMLANAVVQLTESLIAASDKLSNAVHGGAEKL